MYPMTLWIHETREVHLNLILKQLYLLYDLIISKHTVDTTNVENIQCILGPYSLEVKWQRHETDYTLHPYLYGVVLH
jgi:hypothetical protein